MHVRLTGDSKLTLGVNLRVHGCLCGLFLCGTVMDWRPIQGFMQTSQLKTSVCLDISHPLPVHYLVLLKRVIKSTSHSLPRCCSHCAHRYSIFVYPHTFLFFPSTLLVRVGFLHKYPQNSLRSILYLSCGFASLLFIAT